MAALSVVAVAAIALTLLATLTPTYGVPLNAAYVSNSGTDGASCGAAPGTACATVGGALAVVASGATINIAAGTYTVAANALTQSVRLVGVSAASTTLQCASSSSGTLFAVAGFAVFVSNVRLTGCGSIVALSGAGTLTIAQSTITGTFGVALGSLSGTSRLTLVQTALTSVAATNGFVATGTAVFNATSVTMSQCTAPLFKSMSSGAHVLNRVTAASNSLIGASLLSASSGTVKITASNFTANKAFGGRASVFVLSGNAVLQTVSTLFANNYGTHGGTIAMASVTPPSSKYKAMELLQCTFTNNVAAGGVGGGALALESGLSQAAATQVAVNITNCQFTGNKALKGSVSPGNGGAILASFIDLAVTNTNIRSGYSTGRGGAIAFQSYLSLTLVHCDISNNVAVQHGGGISVYDPSDNIAAGRLEMITCNMDNNNGGSGGGAVSVPAMVATPGQGQVNTASLEWIAISCRFTRNRGNVGGGVIWALDNIKISHINCYYAFNEASVGGAFNLASNAYLILQEGTAEYHVADFGGFIAGSSNAMAKVTGGNWQHNVATSQGGFAFLLDTASIYLEKSTVHNNSAVLGGAFYGTGDTGTYPTDCTLTSNNALEGGGVGFMLGDVTVDGSPWFTCITCTISGNQADSGGVILASVSNEIRFFGGSLSNNRALSSGGSVYLTGNSTLFISDLTVSNSYSNLDGGFIFATDVAQSFIGTSTIRTSVSKRGGAYFGTGESMVEFSSVSFLSCKSGMGGAVHLDGAPYAISNPSGKFVNVMCQQNSAKPGAGGCAFVSGNSKLSLANSTLSGNVADYGGALYGRGTAAIEAGDGSMFNNSATIGGLVFADVESHFYMSHVNIYQNSAATKGGAILAAAQASVQLVRCQGTRNFATSGGFAYTSANSSLSLVQGNYTFNTAVDKGGAIYADDTSSVSCKQASVGFNTATQLGGAAYVYLSAGYNSVQCVYTSNTATNGFGGAIFAMQRLTSGSINYCNNFGFKNDQFVQNYASVAGGIMAWDKNDDSRYSPCDVCGMQSSSVIQCSFSGNHAGQYRPDILSPLVATIAVDVQHWKTQQRLVPLNSVTTQTVLFSNATYTKVTDSTQQCTAQEMNATFPTVTSGVAIQPPITLMGSDLYRQSFVGNVNATLVISVQADNPLEAAVHGTTIRDSATGFIELTDLSVIAKPGSIQKIRISVVEPEGVDPISMYLKVRDCRPGEVQPAGSNECVVCAPGKYSWNPKATDCLPCPPHAVCAGGAAMQAQNGFWRQPNGTQFVACLLPQACLGAARTAEAQVDSFDGMDVSHPEGCAEGYMGTLCHQCASGFGRSGQNGCSRCPDPKLNVFLLVLSAIAGFIVLGVMIYRTRKSAGDKSDLLVMMVKIFTSYTQFVSLAAGLDINWPKELLDFFEFQSKSSSIADLIISVDCALGTSGDSRSSGIGVFYETAILYFLSPWIALLSIVLFWGAVFIYRSVFRRDERRSYRQLVVITRENIVVSLLVVLFFLHPTLTTHTFMLFSCQEVVPGEAVLTFDLSVRCYDLMHNLFMLAVGLPSIILYVLGIPAAAFAVMYFRRQQLETEWFRNLYGFLYNGYNIKYFYWECVVMLRKVAVISIIVFFAQFGALVQTGAALGLVYAAFHLHNYAKPYDEAILSRLETYSLGAAVLIFYCAIFLNASNSTAFEVFITVVLFTVQISFMLYFAYKIRGQLFSKIKETVEAVKQVQQAAASNRSRATVVSGRASVVGGGQNLTEEELSEERAYAERMAQLEHQYQQSLAHASPRQPSSGVLAKLFGRGQQTPSGTPETRENPLVRSQEMSSYRSAATGSARGGATGTLNSSSAHALL